MLRFRLGCRKNRENGIKIVKKKITNDAKGIVVSIAKEELVREMIRKTAFQFCQENKQNYSFKTLI